MDGLVLVTSMPPQGDINTPIGNYDTFTQKATSRVAASGRAGSRNASATSRVAKKVTPTLAQLI